MNNDLFELMEKIRKTPGLYLGEKSVIRLDSFLQGYHAACYFEMHKNFLDGELQNFTKWLAKSFGDTDIIGYAKLLLSQTDSDDEAAFDLFWQEWDEFCKENLNEQNENQSVHE